MNSSTHLYRSRENIMGKTLHNKIPLGRTSVLSSKPVQAALLAVAIVSMSLIWMAIRGVQ
jgi:hypothetical protein